MSLTHETLRRIARELAEALNEAALTEETMPLPRPEAPWSDLNPTYHSRRRRNPGTARTRAIIRCADALERIAEALEAKAPLITSSGPAPQAEWEKKAKRIHELQCELAELRNSETL